MFHCRWSTMDIVLTLQLLVELHGEFNHLLHVAHLHIKETFDSVDRLALWVALKGVGVPNVLLNLVHDLHTETCVRVCIGAQLSLHFYTSSGVWQGYILALALFCWAISCILGLSTPCIKIKVCQEVFTSQVIKADDTALLIEKWENFSLALVGLQDAIHIWGQMSHGRKPMSWVL